MSQELLVLRDLVKHYRLPRVSLFKPAPIVEALRGVSLVVEAGRSLGIVGESGSGKSTLARLAMALEAPTSGTVTLLGQNLNTLDAAELRNARRDFQMVFQDPYGSLDPRQRVGRIVSEPLIDVSRTVAQTRVAESLDAVGLHASDADKYPHEFSGGQRQRIAIARALITRPKLIVADEPVSALDVSVQAQVLNLLADLQQDFGVTYLFISHDLAVVDHVCDEVAVMYAGRVVEQGAPEVLFKSAAHPYTRALMRALPQVTIGVKARVSSARVPVEGSTPVTNGSGCSFVARCPFKQVRCEIESPALRPLAIGQAGSSAQGHSAACHFAESVMLDVQGEN
jgi:peptide/nickel transport system ATP-binding protein